MAEDDRNEQTPEEEQSSEELEPLPEAEAPEETVVEPDAPEPAPAASGETPPPGADEPVSEEAAEELEPSALEVEEERRDDQGEVLEEAAEEARRPRGKASERGERGVKEDKKADVIPGEHLEPILPVEQPSAPDSEFDYAAYVEEEEGAEGVAEAEAGADEATPAPTPLTPKELAADARYQATGKRKTSVARVILKPGSGTYVINGRTLEDFFPRATLQKAVRQPLETAGYEERMDVVARIHGGGVSAQAGALRHGVARALVEADPNLRSELKRRGFLTRDARAKERKKAGLKKARKRPQFSKR
jgi:small subunit ribosomal protein S9